ncbi:MAG: glycosyltransferase family 39 protein [Anaerolineae bacterium]|jgi:4-amino-4-deoxy-L-arabinose transferase-like glycosyltransferase
MSERETNPDTIRPWLSRIVLLLLLVVALLLRWRYVREISLFVDEFVTAWAAHNVPAHGLPIFPSGNLYPHGLLFTYLEVPFVLGPFDETLARIPGLVVGLAGIVVAYGVGRRLLSEEAGLVAAAAMAVDPDFIVWGARARMYGLLQLLALLVIYLYYRGLAEDRAAYRYGAMGLLVAAIFTHLEAAFLLPVLGLATLIALPWRPLRARGTVWRPSVVLPLALGGAGAVAFYLVARFGQPGHLETLEQEGKSYLDLAGGLLQGPQAFAPVFLQPHRLAFTLLALAGLYFLFRPRFDRRAPLTYLYVVLAGFVTLLVLLAGTTWQRERYLFIVLPLLFFVGGEALRRLLRRVPALQAAPRWWPAALAGIVALYAGLLGAPGAYQQEWGYDRAFRTLHEQFDPAGGDRLATSMSTAAYLYLDHNDAFAIQQGYEEYVVVPPDGGLPSDLWTATPVLTTTAAFSRLLGEAPRLWFVTDGWRFQTRYRPDFILAVLDQMELVYNRRGVLIFRGDGYHPRPEPAVERDLRAEFDRALVLQGHSLSAINPAPGDELEVTLYWRALEGAGPAYTALLHLVAPDGRGVGGLDEPVLQGLYQPDLWPDAAVLPDRHRLAIPTGLPPGRYRLDLGLYPSGQAGQALPVGDGDRLPLATLQVGAATAPQPSTPTRVDFGDQIRLLGYDLDRRAGEGGGIVDLVLHWQALRPPDQDYTVFVHLVQAGQAGGPIVDQADGPAGDPFFPTSTWLPGQTAASSHSLALPAGAPATYTILVGLYHPPSNDRLVAVDAGGQTLGDALPLVTLDVGSGSP